MSRIEINGKMLFYYLGSGNNVSGFKTRVRPMADTKTNA
jgi:hypothetical protein